MSDTPTRPAAYDRRTTDHEEIETWVREHGGQPIAIQDAVEDEIDLTFEELEEPIEVPIEWAVFFERFDEQDRLLAYQQNPDPGSLNEAYAFFDRRRVEASNRLGEPDDSESARGPPDSDGTDADPGADPEQVGDGRSDRRHEAATDQENADNHRDDPPFNS